MDWTTPLRSLQADFIQRLKSGHLLHSEVEGTHSELTVISRERIKPLSKFCWEMAEKYKSNSRVRDVFINNMKGKLGEEVVKARLGDLVTEVDYEKRMGGDGKVDFTLNADPNVGIQVKARHGGVDTVKWFISPEEVEKNAVLVCVLIQEEVSEAQAEYHLILAGFLPTEMIEVKNGKASLAIDELLYGGGVKSCLGNFSDKISLAEQYYQEGKYEQAIKYCTEILQINPNYASAYFWRGFARGARKDYSGAIEDYTQAIQINPNYASAYFWRGISREEMEDYSGAIEDDKKAAALLKQQGN